MKEQWEGGQKEGIKTKAQVSLQHCSRHRVFRMGNRSLASSPSLCRDKTQRETVISPGSHSRARLNRPQQRVPPPNTPSLFPAPRHPAFCPTHLCAPLCSPSGQSQKSQYSASSCLEKTAPPSQVDPAGVSFSKRAGLFWKISWGLQAGRSEVTQGQVGGSSGRRLGVPGGGVLCESGKQASL